MATKETAKNSLIDVAADLIGQSGIGIDDIVELASTAVSGASKSGSSSKKKESKSDSLISKLVGEKVDYPQFSEKTYWAIREKFQKNIPEKVTASTLTNPTGLKADTIKSTVLPALETLGLLKDGKPTTKLKSWVNDAKYDATCTSIAESVYPNSLTKLPFNTQTQQTAIINWFKKNADVSEATAKKMMNVYLLLANPQLKTTTTTEKKSTSTSTTKKSSSTSTTKKTTPTATVDSVKVTKKSGKATITVKIIADEGITKKALSEKLSSAATEAYNQMK